jgi:hypothetical protein
MSRLLVLSGAWSWLLEYGAARGTCRDLRVCLEMWDLECRNDGLSFKGVIRERAHDMVSGWFWKPDFAFMMNGDPGGRLCTVLVRRDVSMSSYTQ